MVSTKSAHLLPDNSLEVFNGFFCTWKPVKFRWKHYRQANFNYFLYSFLFIVGNTVIWQTIATRPEESFFKPSSLNEWLIRHENVFDTDKDEVNELDISSWLRSESSSNLLSFNSNNVVGRLNKSFQFWRDTLQAKDFVIDIISSGYKLPLLTYPPRCFIKNNKSTLVHKVSLRKPKGFALQILQRYLTKEGRVRKFFII